MARVQSETERGLEEGKGGEGGAREAEGAEVVGVGGRKVVTGIDGLLHQPLLAPSHHVLVIQFQRRTTHLEVVFSKPNTQTEEKKNGWWVGGVCLLIFSFTNTKRESKL